jgi:hypothetical protein
MSAADFESAIKTYLKLDTEKANKAIEWFSNRGGRQVVTPDIAVSGGVDIAVSGGVDIAVSTKPSITINEPPFKKISAKADYSRPVSLLSEKEVKALELTISDWKQYLADEQAERGRKGVIDFIEGKIRYWSLLPRNPSEIAFFGVLKEEYEAEGRDPPKKFPCLETKRLFNEAAEFHNGTLEVVIRKAIHKRGKGIAKIVDYINSPEWRKKGQSNGPNAQARNQTRNGRFAGQAQCAGRTPQPGNGRTPEMQAALEAAFK